MTFPTHSCLTLSYSVNARVFSYIIAILWLYFSYKCFNKYASRAQVSSSSSSCSSLPHLCCCGGGTRRGSVQQPHGQMSSLRSWSRLRCDRATDVRNAHTCPCTMHDLLVVFLSRSRSHTLSPCSLFALCKQQMAQGNSKSKAEAKAKAAKHVSESLSASRQLRLALPALALALSSPVRSLLPVMLSASATVTAHLRRVQRFVAAEMLMTRRAIATPMPGHAHSYSLFAASLPCRSTL